MDGLDLKSMRLDVYQATPTQRKEKPPRHKQGEKFLKGPVPLKWLERAACLPGKALHLGIVIWFLAGLKNLRRFPVPNSLLVAFGVDCNGKYRALRWLEEEGLVKVERHPGRNPVVTILGVGEMRGET